jgi:hypothetical protein
MIDTGLKRKFDINGYVTKSNKHHKDWYKSMKE